MAQSVYRLYYGPDDQGLEYRQVKEVYLSSCTSNSTQPPTERVPVVMGGS
jgi:hypothetical protein